MTTETIKNNLKELQETFEVPNLYTKEDIRYSTEFNVFTYYKNGSTECANSTYSTLAEAYAKAKEWYDAENDIVEYIEISLQTNICTYSSSYNDYIAEDTIGDVVVAYITRE